MLHTVPEERGTERITPREAYLLCQVVQMKEDEANNTPNKGQQPAVKFKCLAQKENGTPILKGMMLHGSVADCTHTCTASYSHNQRRANYATQATEAVQEEVIKSWNKDNYPLHN